VTRLHATSLPGVPTNVSPRFSYDRDAGAARHCPSRDRCVPSRPPGRDHRSLSSSTAKTTGALSAAIPPKPRYRRSSRSRKDGLTLWPPSMPPARVLQRSVGAASSDSAWPERAARPHQLDEFSPAQGSSPSRSPRRAIATIRRPARSLEDHPDIVHDLQIRIRHARPSAISLRRCLRRWKTRPDPFTILTCDNLPANGRTVKRVMDRFAALVSPDFGRWVADNVVCPASMVDRIVPATTDEDRSRISVQASGSRMPGRS